MFRQLKTLLDKCRAILEAAKSKGVLYNKGVEESFKIYKQFVLTAEKKQSPKLTEAVFGTYVEFIQLNSDDMTLSNDWYKGAVFYPGGDDSEMDKSFRLNDFHELSEVVDSSGRTTMGLETATIRFFIEVASSDEQTSDGDFIPKMKECLSDLEEALKSSKPMSGTKAVKKLSQKMGTDNGLEGIGELFKNKDLFNNLLGGVSSMMEQPDIREKLSKLAQSTGIMPPPTPLQPPTASSPSVPSAPATPIVMTDDM